MGTALLACVEKHPGLEVVGKICHSDQVDGKLLDVDVVVDFVNDPGVSTSMAVTCAAIKKSIVIGTTGHTDEQRQIIEDMARITPIVMTSNFSIGANLLFWLSGVVTEKVGIGVDIEIVEMHHCLKKDAPSGTALTLAEIIAAARSKQLHDVVQFGRHGTTGPRSQDEIGIHSIRGGDVVGDHTVLFAAIGERIELTHKASSRNTFAEGALRAAEWVVKQKPGLYDMQDVLGLR